MNLLSFFKVMRPSQWIKNLFVFSPLFFSMSFFNIETVFLSCIAFFCFILASSATYIFNDIFDLPRDKTHPLKKHREIASDNISKNVAILWGVLLLIFMFVIISSRLNVNNTIIISTYLIIQIFYNLKLKYIIIADVMTIAFGFVLRVVFGAYAIGVLVSDWIIITTFFLALFLGFGKRYIDLIIYKNRQYNYSEDKNYAELFKYLILITSSCAIVLYGLFLVETANKIENQNLIYTLLFVVFGIFRYLSFLFIDKKGLEPEIFIYRDMPFLINIICWLVSTIWILHK